MYTTQTFQKLEEYFVKIDSLGAETNQLFSDYLVNSKERTHTITRNGKLVEVTEDILWYEVQNLGSQCEAYEFLKSLYPYFFAKTEEREATIVEMEKFAQAELGINALKMSLIDIIKLATGVAKKVYEEEGQK